MSPKVSFRITTYYKRPRSEPGLTQLASQRLGLGAALDWILGEVPGDAIAITSDTEGDHDGVLIGIDWTKVPAEIRDGRP